MSATPFILLIEIFLSSFRSMRSLFFILCLMYLSVFASFAQAQDYAQPGYMNVFAENVQNESQNILSGNARIKPSNALPAYVPSAGNSRDIDVSPPVHVSRIEAYYSDRIIDELPQFGYDIFVQTPDSEQKTPSFHLPAGAVQDDFILNIGDQVKVTFRGQINQSRMYQIGNDGQLIIDRFTPISVAGKSVGAVQSQLQSMIASMPNTEVFLSIDKVRQIGVLVIGNVAQPGRQNLTVFHSVLDALSAAGGIKKDGSLRQVKLVRRGQTRMIDLYALLLYGSDHMDMALQDGDRLIVPPIGPTVAISGNVKRPGVYEIRSDLQGMMHKPEEKSEVLTLQDMLNLAGGVLSPGQNRFVHFALTSQGREAVADIEDPFEPVFRDGSILSVSPTDEMRQGQIEVAGYTRKNGIHALKKVPTLANLFEDKAILAGDAYPLIGVIERENTRNFGREYKPFPLALVIGGDYDLRLQDNDIVHVFSQSQIHNLFDKQPMLFKAMMVEQGSTLQDMSSDAYVDDPVMADVLREHSVFVKGAVRLPGNYPVANGATLEGVLAAAGGVSLDANISRVEITSNNPKHGQHKRRSYDLKKNTSASIPVYAGDTIRMNQKARQLKNTTVLIAGEVLQPGEYNLMPGDTLLALLSRAGGLTPEAYPDGAIFSRARERKIEEQQYQAAARDLERALAVSLNDTDDRQRPNIDQVSMARSLAKELRDVQTVGRITVEASPDMLASHPELDVLLEPGDRIYIPKRPYNVRVRGEVLSPANLQFKSGKTPHDYLMEAGGYTHYADKSRTFVVFPDGSAQPLQVDRWNFKPVMVPPGATIVVPRDPSPLDFMKTAKDISEIFSNLAITGIVIDDIRDDD